MKKMLNKVHITVEGGDLVHFTTTSLKLSLGEANLLIRVWAEQDFGLTSIKTVEDVKELKKRVIESYKEVYPELMLDNTYDRIGLCRIWIEQHLKEIKR